MWIRTRTFLIDFRSLQNLVGFGSGERPGDFFLDKVFTKLVLVSALVNGRAKF
jgi:hypothetical protein